MWTRTLGVCAVAQMMLILTPAASLAQDLPRDVRPYVFLHLVVERGLECNLLSPWQGAVLRAQIIEPTREWSAETHANFVQTLATRAAETSCDDEGITGWIDASGPGFESEYLPPYLVIYRTIALMDKKPRVFEATALRLDYAPVIAAIDAKLTSLEASGAKPDGGKPWPEFIARTEAGVEEIVTSLNGGAGNDRLSSDQAAAYLAQSARITELWFSGIANAGNGTR